jgi:phosphatidylglycerol lysyltransferase
MKPRSILIKFIALVAFGSGILNLFSLIGPPLKYRLLILLEIFPLEFIHLSRFLIMLIGFSLVICSINLYKRKKRAFQLAILLSVFSIIFHFTKGLDYEEASASLILLLSLILARKSFTVKSSTPNFSSGILKLGIGFIIALAYGTAGFWFLESHHFAMNFRIGQAFKETLLYLVLIGDPALTPQTRYAAWFEDSLYFMTMTAIIYSLYSLFRPALCRFRTLPQERHLAQTIVKNYGRSAMDYFKFWPDKSFYFLENQKGFIAYGVAKSYALALADPVGPDDEIEPLIMGFRDYCHENDWSCGFHQAITDFIPIYEKLGFKKLKVGDDAITDLVQFSIEKLKKETRKTIRQLEGTGFRVVSYEPPITDEIITSVKDISDEWLTIPGRRERQFTLGLFEYDYIRSTPIVTAENSDGRILAFVNIIPSFHKGEATNDLMRRRIDAPNGIMDFLFTRLMIILKEQGFERYNLGMSPMAGFSEQETASPEEKAIHYFFQHLDQFFSYRGLHHFKAKFATSWEPRYAIYENAIALPKMALALRVLSEIKYKDKYLIEKQKMGQFIWAPNE